MIESAVMTEAIKPVAEKYFMTDEELADLDSEFKLIHDRYQNKAPLGVHKLHKKIVEAQTKRHK